MNKLFIILLIIVNIIVLKAQFKTILYANGQLKSEGCFSVKDSLKQGPWRFYFMNGKLNSEGSFFNGKYHSEWKYYHESNGKIQKIENWNLGVLHGESREYYPNEKIEKYFKYKNGVYHGLHYAYFEDGSIKKKGYYLNGLPEGTWQIFSGKNLLSEEGYYQQGLQNGWFKLYDELGKLTSEGSYIDGIKQDDWIESKIINSKDKNKKGKKK
ncbi:MAG: toxin-antitoxin system YwqK family antitoxin [Cytophagales bacterium]|nr:MAG: toxin-antitoxin system YwqK family antitoxin [Cytophagales bacterium]